MSKITKIGLSILAPKCIAQNVWLSVTEQKSKFLSVNVATLVSCSSRCKRVTWVLIFVTFPKYFQSESASIG